MSSERALEASKILVSSRSAASAIAKEALRARPTYEHAYRKAAGFAGEATRATTLWRGGRHQKAWSRVATPSLEGRGLSTNAAILGGSANCAESLTKTTHIRCISCKSVQRASREVSRPAQASGYPFESYSKAVQLMSHALANVINTCIGSRY